MILAKLKEQLADNVSALVGLKEALTLRRRPIKVVWILLLCLGLIGTGYYVYNTASDYLANPTATHVRDFSFVFVLLTCRVDSGLKGSKFRGLRVQCM